MDEALWLTALIFLAAVLYSSVGHGGASGYLAAMAFAGVSSETMRVSALALNVLVATIGTIRYARAGYFDWRTLLPFVVTSIPAAFIGGSLHLATDVYKIVVGVMLLMAAAELARSARKTTEAGTRPPLWGALLVGTGIGLLAGLTGTGGGIFLSPVLLLAGWAGTRVTSGISAAFILCNSLAGLAGATTSWASLPAALPLWLAAAGLGALVGTQLGSRLLPVFAVRYALAAVLVVAGMKLILT